MRQGISGEWSFRERDGNTEALMRKISAIRYQRSGSKKKKE